MIDMAGLIEFLKVQIADDLDVINDNTDGKGLSDGFPDYRTYQSADTEAADTFIRHFSPRRMLLEVEAKQKLLTMVECDLADDASDQTAGWAAQVLALPYCQRVGYDEAWKPGEY